MVAAQKSQQKLTTREKKITSNKLATMSPGDMADAWKRNMAKPLSPTDMERFEMIRKRYKEVTHKELPKHKTKTSGG